jgi:hypothetical protein
VLGTHVVDYFARREHVQLQGREGRLEKVPVFSPTLANRARSVQGTAGHAVVRMPCSLHFVEGDYNSHSVVGVGLGLISDRAGAMRRVRMQHLGQNKEFLAN